MTEPTEIRLSLADFLAELALGAMAHEVEMDEDSEEIKIYASTSVFMISPVTHND